MFILNSISLDLPIAYHLEVFDMLFLILLNGAIEKIEILIKAMYIRRNIFTPVNDHHIP